MNQVKLDFILNNFYTDKFKVISFVHKKEDNKIIYFTKTETIKGKIDVVIEDDNKKIKLINPLSVTFTSGYAIIAYIVIFILIIVLLNI